MKEIKEIKENPSSTTSVVSIILSLVLSLGLSLLLAYYLFIDYSTIAYVFTFVVYLITFVVISIVMSLWFFGSEDNKKKVLEMFVSTFKKSSRTKTIIQTITSSLWMIAYFYFGFYEFAIVCIIGMIFLMIRDYEAIKYINFLNSKNSGI